MQFEEETVSLGGLGSCSKLFAIAAPAGWPIPKSRARLSFAAAVSRDRAPIESFSAVGEAAKLSLYFSTRTNSPELALMSTMSLALPRLAP
jgi:hypothetical protein